VTATLIVQPEAEADLGEAFRWYEARRHGLGHEFLAEVSRTFSRIAEQPLRNAPVHREARRALLRAPPSCSHWRGERVFGPVGPAPTSQSELAKARVRDFETVTHGATWSFANA
jgi:hypothetical protein